jgi:hypothetical protein
VRIEYDLSPEDWGAFGEYHARTSPQWKRATRLGVINGMVLVLIGAAVLWSDTRSMFWPVFGVGAAAFWAWYWPRQVVANARSSMTRKDRPCLRGRHVMEALPEGLRAKCDVTDSTITWAGVRNVIPTPSHVFVMLDELQGYVVPAGRVLPQDLESFLREVERFRAA